MKRLVIAAATLLMMAAFSTFAAFDAYMPIQKFYLMQLLSIFGK
jgi:hypothetical protein